MWVWKCAILLDYHVERAWERRKSILRNETFIEDIWKKKGEGGRQKERRKGKGEEGRKGEDGGKKGGWESEGREEERKEKERKGGSGEQKIQ